MFKRIANHATDLKYAVIIPWKNREKLKLFEIIGLIPILNLVTFGYVLESINTKYILPDWNRKLHYFKKAIKALAIVLIFALPVSLIGWFFDMIPLLTTILTLALFYTLPNVLVKFSQKGWNAAFSSEAFSVLNEKYLTGFLKGTVWMLVMLIPFYLIVNLVSLTGNQTLIEIITYALTPVYDFFAAIPFFKVIAESQ